ncbi:hypothetical protein BIW11_06302 [Tropilaelaps mercedesae]|uniref:Uncharacterized protein n=1 Tax=Tropilaelaps mercedesae TaxID=418985 RepID=A0A1V9XYQ4_9ACAR|nr:hypothetical protein BIW11_06302 [Tropilaelaps mercedesae]
MTFAQLRDRPQERREDLGAGGEQTAQLFPPKTRQIGLLPDGLVKGGSSVLGVVITAWVGASAQPKMGKLVRLYYHRSLCGPPVGERTQAARATQGLCQAIGRV